MNPDQVDAREGEDAICYAAGPQGAHFAAGTIHAYLAADRDPPIVVAGISAGSLTAAAMYRAYRDLQGIPKALSEKRESARWKWFRHYLNKLTRSPLAPFWEAIPNPVDFFAETLPVEDPSCPSGLKKEETEARTQYHRLIRLGNWLGGLPITVADVADAVVRYVRLKERYAVWPIQMFLFVIRVCWIACLIAMHGALDPEIAWRRLEYENGKVTPKFWPTALFGWMWPLSVLWLVASIGFLALAARTSYWWGLALLAQALAPAIFIGVAFKRKWLARLFASPIGIDKGLLHKYHLRRWLMDLFEDEVLIENSPMHLLVVAAALNPAKSGSQQVWAHPYTGVRLRDALTAALSVPGLFCPEEIHEEKQWPLAEGQQLPLHLVDGAVVRTNPIPSLFDWMKTSWHAHHHSIEKLFYSEAKPAASLRVVYSVPIQALPTTSELQRESLNIVEGGLISLALQRRRDTEMESVQTDFISSLEAEIRRFQPSPSEGKLRFPIRPLPISPETEAKYQNALEPTREEGLTQVANGCRRTLETIYRHELQDYCGGSEMDCHQLLRKIAPNRGAQIKNDSPGLMEVCRECTKKLKTRPVEDSTIEKSVASYGLASTNGLHDHFSNLTGEKSRIVFLANGGVFRGSFHVGVAAAMRLAKIRPDLVVGSSVGAIIGAAVCRLGTIKEDSTAEANAYICTLAAVFLHCDTRVALTRRFKNVSKQLGVRARAIRVSPRALRQLVRDGSRKDSAYAIVGAPPALIDAIADLFLIPHRRTQLIASKFVGGHITESVSLFAKAVQAETLRQLSIETCVMGAELLEKTANKLLFSKEMHAQGSHLKVQPYPRTAFFATATHLSKRATILLGRDFPGDLLAPEQFDFVESCLASSAFPVVFAPRSVSGLFPGRFRTDALLADGGIFDNLPFFPAISVLSDVQRSYARRFTPAQAYEYLTKRQQTPALLIAAGLDCDADPGSKVAEDLFSIRSLAKSMSNNVKLRSFESTSELVFGMTNRLLGAFDKHHDKTNSDFVNSMVPAAVLKVLPADVGHLNGTFHFCRATGFKQEKMQLSIAHGCFQTLSKLSHEFGALASTDDSLKDRKAFKQTLKKCFEGKRIAPVTKATGARKADSGECPFFAVDDAPVVCPFHTGASPEIRSIHQICAGDELHKRSSAQPPPH